MKPAPYSFGCNEAVKRFYDDFDALPYDIKEMLFNNLTQPDFDDLKAAWELAAEDSSLGDLIKKINCMKPSKEEQKAMADAERERLKREKRDNYWNNRRKRDSYYETRPVYGKARLKDVDPKHARLVMRVTEEEAVSILCKRKENKDVKPHYNYVRPIVGYERVNVVIDPNTVPPEKPEPKQHIAKMLHNAGGKK